IFCKLSGSARRTLASYFVRSAGFLQSALPKWRGRSGTATGELIQSEKSKPIQSMITLKNDSLSFSFPEIDEAILRLTEQHITSRLPAIIAAYRSRAIPGLHSSWWFREATPERRRKAENQAIQATPEEIETAFRRKTMSVVNRVHASITTLEIEFQRTLRIP